eukprot:CAMPEP_0178946294 /NCGR_PEP_ID=MMETSP0789-20121207/4206_1 /TAXON_ID=3005 /ORGANISM="Rhizosolenia setigera, Strain CCMP 1694" /LENGTH=345 /DNA_ID=CAMNT_0020626271 /DNA_START=87 /DNA_END=1127 /DNA_ORIENTATION=-
MTASSLFSSRTAFCTQTATGRTTRLYSSSSTSFSSSDFKAPVPPSSQGQAIYNNIEIKKSTPSTDTSITESQKRNSDPNSIFIVTGASRGIGLQYVKSLVERTNGTIIAACRSPSTATQLHDFLNDDDDTDDNNNRRKSRVQILPLDLENQSSIDEFSTQVEKIANGRVDALFNVAGILGDGGISTPGPERSLAKIEREWFDKTLSLNLIGPVMLTKNLSPFMVVRRSKNSPDRAKSLVVNLSARVGSISDNQLGGWYSYRISKTGLNQFTRSMSIEFKRKGIMTIALHPGTTQTDLSKPFAKNVQKDRMFPVEFSVGQMLDVIDSMEEEHSGGLFDWAGKAIPF